MQLNDNHYNLIFAFEQLYEFLLNDKFEGVNLHVSNSYFINGRFRYLSYSFAFNYCSLDGTLICSYMTFGSSIVNKKFTRVGSFIEFLETCFLNVK